MEKRITDLEIKLAFQEDTINQLDTVVCEQQRQINRLKKQYEQLTQRLQDVSHEATTETATLSEDVPPHY